jgi:hypothetical protein
MHTNMEPSMTKMDLIKRESSAEEKMSNKVSVTWKSNQEY